MIVAAGRVRRAPRPAGPPERGGRGCGDSLETRAEHPSTENQEVISGPFLTRRHNRLNPINPRATDNLPTRRELGSFALRRRPGSTLALFG